MRFQDFVIVVTGGGRGIGKAAAQLFASEGATVVIADIDGELARTAAAEIGVKATPHQVDVTDPAAVDRLFAQAGERFGRIDTLVANAGRPYTLTTLKASEDDWQQCLDLNLKSAWLCAKAAHGLLIKSDRASIVSVASAQGLRSGRTSFPYSAAKGGLLALSRSLAVEYAPAIRVNAIIPGQIESVRTQPYFESFRDPAEAQRRVLSTFPMGRLGKPEDVARAILFLASTDAAWITGSFLTVDGGRDAATLDLSDLKDPQA